MNEWVSEVIHKIKGWIRAIHFLISPPQRGGETREIVLGWEDSLNKDASEQHHGGWRKLSSLVFHYMIVELVWSFRGEGNGNPLQYSCLENPMDGGAWWAAVHGVVKSRARLSDVTFIFHFRALEKEMATHSSILAWRIPGTEEPSGLPSMGSQRVRHDWVTELNWTDAIFSESTYLKIF